VVSASVASRKWLRSMSVVPLSLRGLALRASIFMFNECLLGFYVVVWFFLGEVGLSGCF